MAIFIYKAKKGPQEIIAGTVEAGTKDEAIDKLNQMGYVPVQIKEHKEAAVQKVSKQVPHLRLFSKVRSRDLTIFTSQLSSLVKSKVTLLEAMRILSEQTENPHLKKMIFHIEEELRDGKTLSEGLARYPDIFPPLYINMIRSGESGGILEKSLMGLANFREEEEEFKAKISSALAYPIFIVIVGIITVFVLLIFAIPRLVSVFGEIGQTLPLPTMILISLSEQIKVHWYWLITIVIFFIVIGRGVIKKKKLAVDKLKLRLPLLGDFIKKAELARFSRTFNVLLANGIPVFQAVEITPLTLSNEIFKMELAKVHKDIVDGLQLGESLKKYSLFPSFMTNMLVVGEKGGNLEGALTEVANFYEREVDRTTKIVTSLLEPVIILIMGLVVGFIVLAMLLPIFQINIGMGG